ncbi:MAG: radical SAM protein [Deltaproteobacteria bacterium]|nr:radical SAM protein [Deltaproteobacteria bacterium]
MAARADSEDRLVRFRFRSDRGPTVEVRGEMQHWLYPAQLEPVGDGWSEHAYRLAPGAYQYKFRVGHDWVLDPENPRTRARDGARNSLLMVGGADEPVLHAPARPFVFEEDDGRLCLRVGLRRGHGDRLELRWDEGAGMRWLAMRQVAHEDEHLMFEAHVPGAGRSLEYVFALADGRLIGAPGGAAQTFKLAREALRMRTPEWWRDATVYTIFVDRFRRAGGWPDASVVDRETRAGGNLAGVVEALPYLADLGVSVLHLTPICASHSVHRYDATDPRTVAPELGGEDGLARLFDAAHAAGLRVMLDVAITHVHRDFFAFRDVRENGRESPYWSWFSIQNYPFFEGYEPGYAHYQKGQWQEPLLRAEEPEVVEHLCETFVHWTKRGADGFRIDAAADVPRSVVRKIARAVRATREDVALFAEYTPDNIAHWTVDAVDSATDFVAQQAVYDWLWRRSRTAGRVHEVHAQRRFDRGGPGWTAIAFTATHDQPRFLTLVGDPRIARIAQLFTILRATIPALYYGDEIGLRSEDPSRAFEDSWPDRQCMPWDETAWDKTTHALVRSALHLRRDRVALRRGDEHPIAIDWRGAESPDVLAFRRTYGEETIDIVINGGPNPCRVPLPELEGNGAAPLLVLGEVTIDGARAVAREGIEVDAHDRAAVDDLAGLTGDAHPAIDDARTRGLDHDRTAGADGERANNRTQREIVLGPWSAVVLDRVRELPENALDDATALANNRLLGALAFREGATVSPAYPANLYVTITEACNLRCQHCITHAPELTQAGRARALRPWLLDALREAFAAADYFAFAHGGESLISPVLFDVLAAIRKAHAGRPGRYDAHLLTNGMLLRADTTRKLIDAGVTSIMVSLDGARAETNDVIRAGGRIATVLANLRDAIAIRREANPDLRIGLSTVVGVTNVGELAEIAAIAVDLGVDWLKIEETYPATPFARRDLIKPSAQPVIDSMAIVRETLARSKVVLVDHLDPPGGCTCEADRRADGAALRAFRAADDFANRTSFHPCRAAWEQACIDPDGTVHPVDYFQPAIGNLQDTPFLDVWNSPIVQRMRGRALSKTQPDLRRICTTP